MDKLLPISLLVYWTIFFGMINTHQRQCRNFNGRFQLYFLAIQLSTLLGTLTIGVLLLYYLIEANWYIAIILFIFGSIVGGIVFGTIDNVINSATISFISFAWPILGYKIFKIVQSLNS